MHGALQCFWKMADRSSVMANDKSHAKDREREETTEEFIARFGENQADLRNAIAFLIHRRELLRDCEIEILEQHCDKLIDQVAKTKQRILLEELDCFKEVLRLHRRLQNDEQSRD